MPKDALIGKILVGKIVVDGVETSWRRTIISHKSPDADNIVAVQIEGERASLFLQKKEIEILLKGEKTLGGYYLEEFSF